MTMKVFHTRTLSQSCALEGAHTSTVTSVDAVHTYASALAYVDASSRGATPDVWLSPYVALPLRTYVDYFTNFAVIFMTTNS